MSYVLCNPLQKPMIRDAVVKRSHDVLAKVKVVKIAKIGLSDFVEKGVNVSGSEMVSTSVKCCR